MTGDEQTPRCLRCEKVGRECVRGWNVKFVHGVRTTRETVHDEWDGSADYRFDADQEWLPIQFLNSIYHHFDHFRALLRLLYSDLCR